MIMMSSETFTTHSFEITCFSVWVCNMVWKIVADGSGMTDLIVVGNNSCETILTPDFPDRSK